MDAAWATDPASYLDRDFSLKELSTHLRAGELALFLGAGVSVDFNLPSWWKLVWEICKAKKVSTSGITKRTPSDILMKKAGTVEAKVGNRQEFIGLVKHHLYKGAVPDQERIVGNRLLSSLGALVMSSRRGSVGSVFTLNFDDILESYLDLHGFNVQVIPDTPLTESECDIRVYHPHGFLPRTTKYLASQRITFTKKSYLEAITDSGSAWNIVLKNILLTKRILFVGLSGDDLRLQLVIHSAYQLDKSRPIGYMLVRKADCNDDRTEELLDSGIIPVRLDDFTDYPNYILEICQRAASLK